MKGSGRVGKGQESILLTGTLGPIGKLTVRGRGGYGHQGNSISILYMRHRKVKSLREGHLARTSGSAHLALALRTPQSLSPGRRITFPEKKER